MNEIVVIVESPSKVKILGSFLPKHYKVTACYGHVKNIPSKSKQVLLNGKEVSVNWEFLPAVNRLKDFVKKCKNCRQVIIATDPDREGERIAMDLYHIWCNDHEVKRITFNAITKNDVLKAIQKPSEVDFGKAYAAQARAVIDYYFGFNISPWLWRVLPQAKSMGRVQAPSLHWLVDKELSNLTKPIEKHCTVYLTHRKTKVVLSCRYNSFQEFKTSIKGKFDLGSLQTNKRTKTSAHVTPFNTLTIQKYVNSRFRLSAQVLMRYLQDMYAGKISDIEGKGLITYMRTDSVRLSTTFIRYALIYLIRGGYGEQINWPRIKVLMSNQGKGGQDAHEAIRPVTFSVGNLKGWYRKIMFEIIRRTLQAFIRPSVYEVLSYSLRWGSVEFKSRDYLKLLTRGNNEFLGKFKEEEWIERERLLDTSDWYIRLEFKTNLNYTNYSEGNLISSMQRLGVGRPSTWSQIRYNLNKRMYIDSGMKPESLGFLTERLINTYFHEFTMNEFTKFVEANLDEIEFNNKNHQEILKDILESIDKKIKEGQEVNWDLLINDLRSNNTRSCCGQEANLYFSRKGRVWLFFRCSVCGGILPFDYKPINVRRVDDTTYVKSFVWKGKVVDKEDVNDNNFLTKL